ncbi:unnamed protein product [Dibothriocephalus latus]|uniref:Uncharacterized protein n=1 Tax=Dibothriocephalus latus TaxID=60516 RepID=A0A3P6Q702_DIBLA|nr:unnamed protein product [Dibothriocephalus latus]
MQGGSPYASPQQASVQRPMRPPLPSYNQALAMKQQQMPPAAFAVMGGAHDSPRPAHMVPGANAGIPSRVDIVRALYPNLRHRGMAPR